MGKQSMKGISLKKKLVFSFVGVVLFTAILSAFVFSWILVGTMKSSSLEKIRETLKIALSRENEILRGLEIYTDLIASDMTFGQVLSFDSSLGIEEKIKEFKKLSMVELVSFIPQPKNYVQIRNRVFVNSGSQMFIPELKTWIKNQGLLNAKVSKTLKGWILLKNHLFLFATKPVLYFGTNMGSIFLARKVDQKLAQEISQATGTDIALFSENSVFGTSLDLKNPSTDLLRMNTMKGFEKGEVLLEDFKVGENSYFSLIKTLQDLDQQTIAKLALLISTQTIQETQDHTLKQVLWVAGLCALFSALIGFLSARTISNPIQSITQWIQKITEHGDLKVRIQGSYKAEIGILAFSFNELLGRLQVANDKLAASEQRMRHELTMASTVQEMLFPPRLMRLQNLELASFIDTSTETGGDWYGYAEDQEKRKASILIGDVTGHGMPAALITAITNGFFKGIRETEDNIRKALEPMKNFSPQPSLEKKCEGEHPLENQKSWELGTDLMLSILNQILLESTQGRLLMTFFASVFDSETRTLRYSNAGHNRPIVCKTLPSGDLESNILMSPPSHRLGEFSKVEYQEQTLPLHPGDVVIWYTDGLVDCENEKNESYGKRRVLQILKKHISKSSEEISKALISDAYGFYGDTPRKDDITLVVGKVF